MAKSKKRLEELRRAHAHLYRQKVVRHEDGRETFDQATLFKRHGINVLFLRGTRFEMAFQHGTLLRQETVAGAPVAMAKLIDNTVANALGTGPRLSAALTGAIHGICTDRILRQAVRINDRQGLNVLDEGFGMAESTGVPLATLLRSIATAESMQVLGGVMARAPALSKVALLAPVNACSSFAAWGDATAGGRLLIGRNMDYPLNGFYDRFPTVTYFDPTDGGQKHMAAVSAGVHNVGLTAINASGIYVAVHTIFTERVKASLGMIGFMIGAAVVRNAKTLAEAISTFKSAGATCAGWAYLVVSTKERKAAVVELSADGVTVRHPAGDTVVQTNHYLSADGHDRNSYLCRAVHEDNDARYLRIQQRLASARGALTPAGAADILTDHHDPLAGVTRGLGATVGMHSNMTSLVVAPDEGRIFVAAGEAPVSHNDFVEFPLPGAASPEDFRPGAGYQTLPGGAYERAQPDQYAAMRHFIAAKAAYEYDRDHERARELLGQAAARDPANPSYHIQQGILALKTGRDDEAFKAFERVESTPYRVPHLTDLARYGRGMVLGMRGRKAEALALLEPLAACDAPEFDPKLRRACRRAIRQLKVLGRVWLRRHRLNMMMQFSDLIDHG